MQLLSSSEPSTYPVSIALTLSPSAAEIYKVLREAGQLVKAHRGYHAKTSQVTFFCPLEVVALAAGVSRRTLYYKLPELAERRLVKQTGHYATYNGQTRRDGSLWAVRLSEGTGEIAIDHDWLKKSYRNLGADIEAGKTAYAIAQSKLQENKPVGIESILSFAITTNSQAITNDCAKDSRGQLEEILDLAYVPKQDRNRAVDSVARTIAGQLGADSSVMFFRWLCWNLLRLEKQDKSYFYQVFLLIQRAKIDREESACTNPAGLFVSRLKRSSIWDELRSVGYSRIGLPPS